MPLLKGHRPVHKDLVQTEAIGATLGELQTALSKHHSPNMELSNTLYDQDHISAILDLVNR